MSLTLLQLPRGTKRGCFFFVVVALDFIHFLPPSKYQGSKEARGTAYGI